MEGIILDYSDALLSYVAALILAGLALLTIRVSIRKHKNKCPKCSGTNTAIVWHDSELNLDFYGCYDCNGRTFKVSRYESNNKN